MKTPRPRITAIELTRTGAVTGDAPGWRINLPMSVIHTLPDERELPEPVPSIAHNAAELMHDAEFAKCMALVKRVAKRIASGDLAPLPPAAE